MDRLSLNSAEKITVADDWRRNWQESIAVRISALVLWITVPLVILGAIINLSSAEQVLRKEFNDKIDLLAFRTGNALLSAPSLEQQRFRDTLQALANSLDFQAMRVSINDDDFVVGTISPESETLERGIPAVLPNNPGIASTVRITGYHVPFHVMVQKQRENTLVAIVGMLTVFGLFLVWAIRTIVHRPLRALVDATRQVSEGNTELRLDSTSVDEFGTLGRFFNRMLDVLMVQQKKIESALADAERATRAKSVFLANMSHELRTPLNAIIGYSDMLAEEAETMGQQAIIPDLYKIKTAGKHLLDLINNILDISKIEAGKMELYVETVDVRGMIQDIVTTVEPLVQRNDNLLRVEISEHPGTLRSDVTKLRQALLNLLSNAAKFTHRGTLNLKVVHDLVKDPEHIRFIVSDTGIGMSDETLRTVFQPFAQGDGSIVSKYGGTGLGLAISRHYINLMGGDIYVKSVLGQGTSFTIILPLKVLEEVVIKPSPVEHRGAA